MAARTRPTGVIGTVSSHATVVRVTMLHHVSAGMLEDSSGWAFVAAKYPNVAATARTRISEPTVANSWPALWRITAAINHPPRKY